VLSYSESRRLINIEEFSLILLLRAYYNLIRKEIPDKNKPYIIEVLLLSLYYCEGIDDACRKTDSVQLKEGTTHKE
jgi:hypothetical protein